MVSYLAYTRSCTCLAFTHGNVKVDSKFFKSGGFTLAIIGIKSEIRISKYETISKSEYQMIKTFRVRIHSLKDFELP